MEVQKGKQKADETRALLGGLWGRNGPEYRLERRRGGDDGEDILFQRGKRLIHP